MSLLSGLLAGSTGHPPSRGGGCEGARATRPAREGAAAGPGAKPEARAGASARLSTRPIAIGVLRDDRGAPERLGLTLQTLREPQAAANGAGRSFVRPPRGAGAGQLAASLPTCAGESAASTDGRDSSRSGAPQCQQ
jgi:hypothetical protein